MRIKEIELVIEQLKQGARLIKMQGLANQGYKAYFLYSLYRKLQKENNPKAFVLVTRDSEAGEEVYNNLKFFLEKFSPDQPDKPHQLPLLFFPSLELLPYENSNPLEEIVGARLNTLYKLTKQKNIFLIAPFDCLIQKTINREFFKQNLLRFETGDSVDRETISTYLIEQGFSHEAMTEDRGQFSLRGGIFDIFPANLPKPIRMEFNGDTIESIRVFDPVSQTSIKTLNKIMILPPQEGLFKEKKESLFSYLPAQTLILLDDPLALNEKNKEYFSLIEQGYSKAKESGQDPLLPEPEKLFISPEELTNFSKSNPMLELSSLNIIDNENIPVHNLAAELLENYSGRLFVFLDDLKEWLKQGIKVVLVYLSPQEESHLKEILKEYEIGGAILLQGRFSQGFKTEKLIIFPLSAIFTTIKAKKPHKGGKKDLFFNSLRELKPRDLVVHIDYGIGRYIGIKEISYTGNTEEFLELEYAQAEKLYLPMDKVNRLQRYYGAEEVIPGLDTLGGASWLRVKERVKKSLRVMAKEIVRINALRELTRREAYPLEENWHQEFIANFEFEETEDQLKAIEEIYKDLDGDKPMDRLVCGDVGYGKTEVAMRAAMRVVMNHKQVAILVPTTLLAVQHFKTFSQRFKQFPIKVEVLSRFKTKKEQKEIIAKITSGEVDLIIATHRLLQGDLHFKNLGLIIIDEEQRFGVAHKEKLKTLRTSVDVLTLTATPIPRTLHLALSGVKEISIIETPPLNRQAIKTYIAQYNKDIIKEAILREKERGGQIFFVHNRVSDIEKIAEEISALVPGIKYAIGHGQMHEKELETTMFKFMAREIDLLFCTTIVESGLDIPAANTIIINQADKFGLADLYQLRGRVGRERHQAYAYFLISNMHTLTDQAKKRLEAIEELSELGAGFRLAARDMEIRGTGNMLGYEQSGHVSMVGFDLYCQLMQEAVAELKGDLPAETVEPAINMGIKGFIPKEYIPIPNQRIDFYRRLYLLGDLEELVRIRKELIDRFGKLPQEVITLLMSLEIKILAQKLKIEKVDIDKEGLLIYFHSQTPLSPQKLGEVIRKHKPEISLKGEFILQVKLISGTGDGWKYRYQKIKNLLLELAG